MLREQIPIAVGLLVLCCWCSARASDGAGQCADDGEYCQWPLVGNDESLSTTTAVSSSTADANPGSANVAAKPSQAPATGVSSEVTPSREEGGSSITAEVTTDGGEGAAAPAAQLAEVGAAVEPSQAPATNAPLADSDGPAATDPATSTSGISVPSTADAAVAAHAEAADELSELAALLRQARQAVALLEAAVARQEQRLARLAGGVGVGSGGALPPSGAAAARQSVLEAVRAVQVERGGGVGGAVPAGTLGQLPLGGAVSASAVSGAADWLVRHFSLRAAASAAAASVTCAFPYELPHPNSAAAGGGPLQYIVVGDAAGALHLLSAADGRPLAAVPSGAGSAVTACSAYYVRRYESVVVTGHADGQTRSFTVQVQEEPAAAADEEPPAAAAQRRRAAQQRDPHGGGAAVMRVVVQSVALRHVVPAMPPGALPWAAVEELVGPAVAVAAAPPSSSSPGEQSGAGGGAAAAGAAAGAAAMNGSTLYTGPPAPIMHIVPYKQGHKAGGRRHLLVLDRAGNVRLERDNGTLRYWARTNRTQLAVRFVGNYAVMLSAQHATLLNALQPRPPRAFVCQHLNGSRMLAAAFDGHRAFRGHAINGRGELLSLVTPHEGRLTACKAHRATPLPWLDPASLAGAAPLSLTPLRGYLLLTHGSGRHLLNVTGLAPARTGPPTVAAADDAELVSVVRGVAAASPTLGPAGAGDASTATTPSVAAIFAGLPPPPVVAVAPGSQLLVLALPPPPLTSKPEEEAAGAHASEPVADPAAPVAPEGSAAGAAGGAAGDDGTTGSGASAGGGLAGVLLVLDSRLPRIGTSASGGMWGQPVFIAAMVLVGLYQFWRLSNARSQRRGASGAGRTLRSRRAYGVHGTPPYGTYGEGDDYPYGGAVGSPRVPLQPRSALRRERSSGRPAGRSVTYQDPVAYYDDDY